MCGPVRDSHGGGVQKIIVAGGIYNTEHSDILNTVEVYDISLNTWETGVYDNDHINGNLGKEHLHMSVSNSLRMFQVPAFPTYFQQQPSLNMTTPSISLEDTAASASTVTRS